MIKINKKRDNMIRKVHCIKPLSECADHNKSNLISLYKYCHDFKSSSIFRFEYRRLRTFIVPSSITT